MTYLKLAEVAAKFIPWQKLLKRRRRCLLIVDDNESDAGFLEALIKNVGFDSESVTTAEAALALVRRRPQKYPVAFVDMRLPLMTGWDLISKLLQESPQLHIVVVCGILDDLAHIDPAGIYFGVLPKPVTKQAVRSVIAKTRM